MLTDPRSRSGPVPRGAAKAGGGSGIRTFQRAFRATPCGVRDALRSAVARFARQLTPEDAGTLELALAEVLNNVVEHGYSDQKPGLVGVSLRLDHGELICRIEDYGHPMPGLTPPEGRLPDIGDDVGALAEGGWGWGLIHALTEDLSYTRRDGRNVLAFRIPVTRIARS